MKTRNEFLRYSGYVAAAMAAITLYLTWKSIFLSYSPLPFWDQWEWIGNDQLFGHMFDFHNEHRLAVPNLFFAIDNFIFGGNQAFSIFSIQVIQIAHLALLLLIIRSAGVGTTSMIYIAGIGAALLFSPAQIENFYWGFQVQIVLVYFLASLCFWLTTQQPDKWKWDIAAAAAGSAAVFSFAIGLMVLPIAVVIAFSTGQSRRRLVVLIISCLVSIFLFFQGYESPVGHSNPVDGLGHLIEVIYYALVYLGGPIGLAISRSFIVEIFNFLADPIQAAKFVGAAGILFSGALGYFTIVKSRSASRYTLLAIIALVLASSLMTALGRWEFGAQQALASRYASPVLIFWTSLMLLGWGLLGDVSSEVLRNRFRGGLVAGGFAVSLLLLIDVSSFMNLARHHRDQVRGAESSILTQVYDETRLTRVYPSAAKVAEQSELLAARGMSIFGRTESEWLGSPLRQIADRSSDTACIGSFDVLTRLEVPLVNGAYSWRAIGWAWDNDGRRTARQIVLTDETQTIIGLGFAGEVRVDVAAAFPSINDDRTGWMAHGRSTVGGSVNAFAILKNGSACELEHAGSVEIE